MGIVSSDYSADMGQNSGSDRSYHLPPAIYKTLNQDELYDRNQFFYQGSGGDSLMLAISSPSGASTLLRNDSVHGLKLVLDQIERAFALNISELTKICRVQSRKTIYNWRKGTATPRDSTTQRLFELAIIARALQVSNLTIDAHLLKMPIIGTQSFLDLLREDQLDREKILFAASRLNLTNAGSSAISDPFD